MRFGRPGLSLSARGPSGIAAPTSTFTMSPLTYDHEIIQRSTFTGGGQSKGRGSVKVTISGASAGTINARLRSAADGTTILQAEWAAATIANGATTVTITGVDVQGLAWFYLDLRDSGGWKSGTTVITLGDLIAYEGQSLAAYGLKIDTSVDTTTLAALSITPSDYTRIFCRYNNGFTTYNPAIASLFWEKSSDAGNFNGALAACLLNYASDMAGVPVGLVGYAEGGRAAAYFASGAGLTNFQGVTNALNQIAWRFHLYYQGHSDAGSNTSAASYKAQLDLIKTDVTNRNTLVPVWLMASIGYNANNTYGGPIEIATIRKAMFDWTALLTGNGGVYIDMPFANTSDGTHYKQSGEVLEAQQFARALRPTYSLSNDAAGPSITSATRSGTTISATISIPSGATALVATGTLAKVLRVCRSGDTTNPLPITSASVSGTTLTVNLTTDPGDGADLLLDACRHFDGWIVNNGTTNMLNDNYLPSAPSGTPAFAQGRPIRPTFSAAIAVPKVSGSTINSLPAFTLTGAGTPAYAASQAGYGNALSGGNGALAFMTQYTGTGSIIAKINFPSAPASTVLIACFGEVSTGVWMGMDSSGRLLGGNIGATYTTTNNISGGAHEVAICWDNISGHTRNMYFFVDGTLVKTQAIATAAIFTGFDVQLGARAGINGSFRPASGVLVDEVQFYNTMLYTSGYVPAIIPLLGNEANLLALYHMDSDLVDAATTLK